MGNQGRKSKAQKIKENKPRRREKTSQEKKQRKELIKDTKTYIRILQQKNLALQAIERLKKKVQKNQEIRNFLWRQRDANKRGLYNSMANVILRQRGSQFHISVGQLRDPVQGYFFHNCFDMQGHLSLQSLEQQFPEGEVNGFIQRLQLALQDNHEQQQNQSDSENQNQNP